MNQYINLTGAMFGVGGQQIMSGWIDIDSTQWDVSSFFMLMQATKLDGADSSFQVSSNVAMPVDRMVGRPVRATYSSSGMSTISKEAIL